MNFLLETLRLGLANLFLHKLRSLLTALGIIFGVSAVIVMVAIGEGNKQRALADIQQLGARNIIINSIKPPDNKNTSNANRMMSYGLLRSDIRRIETTVEPIERLVVLKGVGSEVKNGAQRSPAAVFGTQPDLLTVTNMRVARGRYLSAVDMAAQANVAVIGSEVASRLFPLQDPLQGYVHIGEQVFRVVGVLAPVGLAGGAGSALVGRDLNFDVHIPLTAAEHRFGDIVVKVQAGSREITQVEVSQIYIQVPDEKKGQAAQQQLVLDVADQVKMLMEQTHSSKDDITTIVPLELLLQAQRTLRMFNALMAAIASISLLVGGIGIMNIMLASVTERTREIGIRRALGATRRHIIAQFLVETTVLSGMGGVAGIALGLAGIAFVTVLNHFLPGIERPQLTMWSVVVSFFVASGVGVVFGIYPAFQAARQDPIVALRHD
jgi:putative ABC transport system permease protein